MKPLEKVQIILFKDPTNPQFLLLKTSGEKSIWQGITGGVEESDSSLKAAAVRELQEELGVITTEDKIIDLEHNFEFTTNRNGYEGSTATEHCFAFEFPNDYTVTLSKEHEAYLWLPLKEALEKIDYDNPKETLRLAFKKLQTIK